LRYDRLTRLLHAGVAFGITVQMGLSLVMEAPDDKDEVMATGLPLQLFEAHRYIGMALLAVLILHWLWSVSGHVKGGFGHLFPWFSGERMAKVAAETREILRFKLLDPDADNELAGAVHGLGLLVATAMAATGAVLFFTLSPEGHMAAPGNTFHKLHGLLSKLMWAYLIGHFAVAVLHKRLGHSNVKDMFSLFK
jgi:cytochrome b561